MKDSLYKPEQESQNHKRYLISRFYVAASVLLSCFVAMFETSSMYHTIFIDTKLDGTFIWGVVFICSLALVDVLINDVLPNKYEVLSLYNNRHIIYMTIALSMFAVSAAITYTYGSTFYLGRLWLDGLIAAVVAILDTFARHKGNSWRYSTP